MCMYTHAYTTHTKGCVCLITIDGVMPPHSTYQGLSQLDPIPSSLLLGQCHVHINFWFLSTPPSKKKKGKIRPGVACSELEFSLHHRVWWLRTAYDSSARTPSTFFWLLQAPICMSAYRHTHINCCCCCCCFQIRVALYRAGCPELATQ